MYLEKINITDYKNIKSAELEFTRRINCFVGSNGAGKTNFLDAIYYLSLCKSLSSTTDRQSVRHGSTFFIAEGEYTSSDSHNIYTFSYSTSPLTKSIKRNGKSYPKISEHIGAIPLVSVTPNDSALIGDSGDYRRKYLNSFISQVSVSYLNALIKYNSVIGQRNMVLKDERMQDKAEILEIYDMQLSELGHIIYDKRNEIVAELSPIVSHYYSVLSGEAESVELVYRSALETKNMSELLSAALSRDLETGYTSVGITRDDLTMKIDGYAIKRFGSQGQQKSFLIALKLAQFDIIARLRGVKPILLLDDIFDRLDGERVRALLSLVGSERFGQIFISDCDMERVNRILSSREVDYRVFNVNNGDAEWKKNIL